MSIQTMIFRTKCNVEGFCTYICSMKEVVGTWKSGWTHRW